MVLEVLRHSLHTLGFERQYRMKLVLGDADRADSWTDGSTHVVLNRKLIKQFGTDLAAWIQYGQILIYNLCCDRDNREVDDHSPEFWQTYAEKCDEVLSRFVDRCVLSLPGAVERLGRRLTKEQERQAEKLAKLQLAGKELDALTRPSAKLRKCSVCRHRCRLVSFAPRLKPSKGQTNAIAILGSHFLQNENQRPV